MCKADGRTLAARTAFTLISMSRKAVRTFSELSCRLYLRVGRSFSSTGWLRALSRMIARHQQQQHANDKSINIQSPTNRGRRLKLSLVPDSVISEVFSVSILYNSKGLQTVWTLFQENVKRERASSTLKTEQRTSGELLSAASSITSFFKKSVMIVGGSSSQHFARILQTPRMALQRTVGWGSSRSVCGDRKIVFDQCM